MFHNKLYSAGYASEALRGVDDTRPWDLNSIILSKIDNKNTMLDIGSGDARKLLPLAKYVQRICAMEPSYQMRILAKNKIKVAKINNIDVVAGISDNLPFPEEYFHLVTCSLAPWNVKEVFRVLKSGGYFINEAIGCEDKLEFKQAFGEDSTGNLRGQRISQDNISYINTQKLQLEQFFDEISITNGFWDTYYTREGLLELCKFTSTINEFDEVKDLKCFDNIIKKLMTPNGIKITQNRLLITARKL